MKNIHQKLFGMKFKYLNSFIIVFLIPLIGIGQDLSTDLEEGKQKYNQKEFKEAIKISSPIVAGAISEIIDLLKQKVYPGAPGKNHNHTSNNKIV